MSLAIETPAFIDGSHSRAIDLDHSISLVDYIGGARLPPRSFLPYYPLIRRVGVKKVPKKNYWSVVCGA
jgi:hypothetical protein